ncbi:adenylosuccinate synthase [Clostridium massiliamazoniense]|uniref:adenylosuccinate synthase n=1 Tax=Clostridium massiliamazoniense TaxID=1347366 RepID=UPI0006D816BA|nr:adenylosuccinate synthase [Clostridium massiliamazoniense]
MSSFVVVGAQWGDEGKGKMTDYLAENADVIVRFQGGNNAGHTVEVGEKQYKLHLIPSGILYEDKLNVIGNGVVVDPRALFKEIDYLKDLGVDVTPKKLIISDRAHIIMPYHIEIDKLSEKMKGSHSIGTTFKGIGPCYTDKFERIGIRVCDLIDNKIFEEKLRRNLEIKNKYIKEVLNGEELKFEEIFDQYNNFSKRLEPFVKDTSVEIFKNIKNEKNILFEGAQGMLLDIDYGTYPYVTSSNTTSCGVASGVGIGPNLIDEVLGIAKAYTTRVGKGPFPTELNDEIGEWIREKGHEYGVTTGRSRRCGWLDTVILKKSARVNGLTSFTITKIDTLAGLDKVKLCIAYELDGEKIDYFPASLEKLARCKPIYEEFDGWSEEIEKISDYKDIPENAKKYIRRIEELTETKVSIISVGPKRSQTIRINY